jgi:hypothetical protein
MNDTICGICADLGGTFKSLKMYILHMSSNMTDISDVPVMDDAEGGDGGPERNYIQFEERMVRYDPAPQFPQSCGFGDYRDRSRFSVTYQQAHQRSCVGARATSSLRTNHQRSDIGIHHHIPPSADGHA